MKKAKIKNSRGITLVALVITIVILIILATITINVAFGEGGLIERAQQAKELTERATKDEEEKLNAVMSEYGDLINGMNGGENGTNEVDPEPVNPELEKDKQLKKNLQEIMQEITATGGTIEREDIIEKLTEKVGEEGIDYTVSQTEPYTVIFTEGSHKLYLIDEDGSVIDDIDQIWIKLGEEAPESSTIPDDYPPEGYIRTASNAFNGVGDTIYKDDVAKYNMSYYKWMGIPTRVKRIDSEAFAEWYYMETVIIPGNVTEIGSRAFYNSYLLSLQLCRRSYDNR